MDLKAILDDIDLRPSINDARPVLIPAHKPFFDEIVAYCSERGIPYQASRRSEVEAVIWSEEQQRGHVLIVETIRPGFNPGLDLSEWNHYRKVLFFVQRTGTPDQGRIIRHDAFYETTKITIAIHLIMLD